MKLLTYDTGNGPRCGVLQNDTIVDATALLGAAMIHLVGPEVLLEVDQRVQHGAGFQQGDPNPHSGQDVGDGSTARPRPDHHHLVLFGSLLDVSHGAIQAQLNGN